MDFLEAPPSRQLLYLTVCISLLAHLVLLMAPKPFFAGDESPRRLFVRIEPRATGPLAQSTAPTLAPEPTPDSASPHAPHPPESRPAQSKTVTASPRAAQVTVTEPKYNRAQRDDINDFLQSLGPLTGNDANSGAPRNGRQRAGNDNAISIEKIPDGPPVNWPRLQAYLDLLVSRLYRNAAAMNRPESTGHRGASIRVSINPDGGLTNLDILDPGDQPEQAEFTRNLIERSAPYAPFPPAIAASIKSLTITFCVRPPQDNGEKGAC